MKLVAEITVVLLFLSVPLGAGAMTIALIESPALPDSTLSVKPGLLTVQQAMKEYGWSNRDVVVTANLSMALKQAKVIVVPSDLILDDNISKELERYRREGNGLVIIGSPNQSKLNSIGEFTRKLLHGKFELSQYNERVKVAIQFRSGYPGTGLLPAGALLSFQPTGNLYYFRTADTLETIGYYRGGIDSSNRFDRLQSDEAGFVALDDQKNGRLAWIGCNPSELDTDAVNVAYTKLFYQDIIHWCRGEMRATIQPWPSQYSHAVSMDAWIGDSVEALQLLPEIARKYSHPFSISISPAILQSSNTLLKTLAGKQIDFIVANSDRSVRSDPTLGELAIDVQRDLSTFRSLGFDPCAYRVSSLDTVSIEALRLNRMKVSVLDSTIVAAYPDIITQYRLNKPPLVVIGKTNRDDNDILATQSRQSLAALPQQFFSDYENIRKIGGLFRIVLHPGTLLSPEIGSVLSVLVDKFGQSDRIWFVNTTTLAEWIDNRNRLQLLTSISGDTLQLSVTNLSDRNIADARIAVLPPRGVSAELLKIVSLNRNCTYEADFKTLYLDLPVLKPNEIFYADFIPGTPRFFHMSIKTLPSLFIVGGVIIAIFLVIVVYYFLFARRERIFAASEKVSPEEQILDFGIYGQPEQMRNSIEFIAPQEPSPMSTPVPEEPKIITNPVDEDSWSMRSSVNPKKSGDKPFLNNDWN